MGKTELKDSKKSVRICCAQMDCIYYDMNFDQHCSKKRSPDDPGPAFCVDYQPRRSGKYPRIEIVSVQKAGRCNFCQKGDPASYLYEILGMSMSVRICEDCMSKIVDNIMYGSNLTLPTVFKKKERIMYDPFKHMSDKILDIAEELQFRIEENDEYDEYDRRWQFGDDTLTVLTECKDAMDKAGFVIEYVQRLYAREMEEADFLKILKLGLSKKPRSGKDEISF